MCRLQKLSKIGYFRFTMQFNVASQRLEGEATIWKICAVDSSFECKVGHTAVSISTMVCKKQTNYSIITNKNNSLHCEMKGNGFLKREWAMHFQIYIYNISVSVDKT